MYFPDSYFEDEVRDGFYVSSMMKRAWAAQLEVLDMVDQICRKHNIPYFVEWGTLLGAVRHGGMVPWDDDMDICMKRRDYLKFLSVLEQELPEECWFMDYRTSEEVDNMVGRLQNSRTIYLEEEALLEKYHGFPFTAGLDIFQLNFLPSDAEEEKSYYHLLKVIISVFSAWYAAKDDPDLIKKEELEYSLNEIESVCHVSFDRSQPMKQQLYALLENKIALLYEESEAKELMFMGDYVEDPDKKMPKTYYAQAVSMPFENMEIPVPVGYDALLGVHKYGDYMKPVREGSAHEYPYYKGQQEYSSQELGMDAYQYEFRMCDREQEKPQQEENLQDRVKPVLPLFHEAHQNVHELINQGNGDALAGLLEDCQNVAIQIGTMIEEERGEGHSTVKILEDYCEYLFQIHGCLFGNEEPFSIEEMDEKLLGFEIRLEKSVDTELKEKKKVVFIPYKVSYWKSMESVWQAAMEDEDTDVYVIPAPYYYKDALGNVKREEPQYEIEGYPDYVAITSYEKYNFQTHHPDVIVIQCPYDEYNYAMTLHPFFYSENLKKYTDQLVYIPALVMDEIEPEDERAREMLKAYCNMPGVVNADQVIVQSEQMKEVYVELLTNFAGETTKEIWENKILGFGSPVSDYENSIRKEDTEVPEEWLSVIQREDGAWKKIVLYSTSASALLCHGVKMLAKIEETFRIFQSRQEEIAFIWRPDRKVREMLRKSDPGLWQQYRDLLQKYKEEAWGIFDDSDQPECAINLCDACYGDGGTVYNACRVRKKVVMLQDAG